MLHIFTIHSHITLLAALGTIVHEKIDSKDVLLVCNNGYKPRVSKLFFGKMVESLDDEISNMSFFSTLKKINYTKTCNLYIDRISGQKNFIAYIDLMSVFNRYLVMHPNCNNFHIIEEGIVNYADFDSFNLWTADLMNFSWQWNGIRSWRQILKSCIRLFRGRSLRLLSLPIHPNLYTLHKGVKAFCFSEKAFVYTSPPKKEILSFNSILHLIDKNKIQIPNDSWIWIGDTLSLAYKISITHFENAIIQLMDEINPMKEKHSIFIKFRGPELIEEKEITIKLLKSYNFDLEFIDYDVIMELEFLRAKNLRVLGIASSLLVYAYLMGHKTHSIYKFIPEIYGVDFTNGYQSISKDVGFLC